MNPVMRVERQMALLIDIQDLQWMSNEAMREELQPLLPGVDIRCESAVGDPADIVMVALIRLSSSLARSLPNLRLVQKLGAGVETIVANPDLAPQVRVTRLKTDLPGQEMAEYCLAYVLREQRHFRFHEEYQARKMWQPKAPRSARETIVGVLGLGRIGGLVARTFTALDYQVLGWSRTPKSIQGVDCRSGREVLLPLLGECDYVASVLPSTPATRGLIDAKALAAMKPGAFFINVGRGDLVVESDLLAALDADQLSGAALDVFSEEPLPPGHPCWSHPKLTVTPHVSGWHLGSAVEDVAENYRRLQAGEPLLHEVDREAGY